MNKLSSLYRRGELPGLALACIFMVLTTSVLAEPAPVTALLSGA